MDRKFENEFSMDLLHWSLGVKLEIPRASKHTFYRWILKIRLLCFAWELRRMNEQREPKAPTRFVNGRGEHP